MPFIKKKCYIIEKNLHAKEKIKYISDFLGGIWRQNINDFLLFNETLLWRRLWHLSLTLSFYTSLNMV